MWLSNWTGSAWTRVLHEKFLYDGWNLLGAFNGTNAAIIRSFLWGLDLSGSMQGAGGVGGLIAFRQHSGSLAGSHFPAYDGNGNVMALVDGKTGSASARYEYDPFGQTIRASGTMATANPVRFSSKVVDDETDCAYYGYRHLNPNAGIWLNRDPIAERGGMNLYAFVANEPVSAFDPNGQIKVTLKSLVVNKCGGFDARFMFQLENSPSPEGYIVQEIDVVETFKTCDGKTILDKQHFWEAWPVSAATAGAALPSVEDTSARGETWGTNGEGKYSGTIRFFPKSVTGDLGSIGVPPGQPNGGWGPGGHPESGSLPSTRTKPPWWDLPQTEPEASREAAVECKCCCPWLYNKVTTTPK